MPEYKTIPEKYHLFKVPLKKTIAVFGTMFLLCLLYSYLSSEADAFHFGEEIAFLAVIFTIVFFVSFYLNRKKGKKIYDSYSLFVGEDYLVRKQDSLPDLLVKFDEIVSVSPYKKALLVKGNKKEQAMVILPYITHYDEVESLLTSIKPLTPMVYKNIFYQYPLLLSGIMLVAMAATYGSNNKIIVSVSGTLFTGIITWVFYKIRISEQIDKQTKRAGWFILIVLLSVLANMWIKLTV